MKSVGNSFVWSAAVLDRSAVIRAKRLENHSARYSEVAAAEDGRAPLNCNIRRCRPLLGTFVEITANGPEPCEVLAAVSAAFAAVEQVHGLMSVHEPESELSLLNREAALRPMRVSAGTFKVLRRAHELAEASQGAFDHTVAPTLAQWGLLPANLRRKDPGGWRDVRLLSSRRVRFVRPLAIDLGGIAKGFAVDQAIDALRAGGVTDGVVNAGGDLRAFGAHTATIHLRHPSQPTAFAYTLDLHDAALATSSPCFTERRWRGRRVSHLVDPLRNAAVTGALSVTVRAGECWMADALTKAVLNAPQRAQRLLAKYDAEAFVLAA